MKIGIERRFIAYSIAATVGIIFTHAISVWLRKTFAVDALPGAWPLVLNTLVVAATGFLFRNHLKSLRARTLMALAISVLAALITVLSEGRLLVTALAVPIVGPIIIYAADRIADRLPNWLDGFLRQAPVKSILWVLLALVMVGQTARLSSWLVDPAQKFILTTDHPLFAGHMCMTAYVYAADLIRQGEENVYDQKHYPGLNPQAEVTTSIKNLAPEDPYQYPPQFLLLPWLATAITSDFDLIKIFWFLFQTILFGLGTYAVARYIGGKAGLMAAILIPALYISFPVLLNMQYGQFHMLSIMMGVLAMIWFSQDRMALGGLALACAILSKLAPAVLLVYLIFQRRWRAVAWTLGCSVAISILSLLVLGTKPFMAFMNYQLPNLQSGSAFAFAEAWPEFKDIIVAGNQSPYAFIFKLQALGLPGMTKSLASMTQLIYTVLVIAIAFVAARAAVEKSRQVVIWLALLNLAALISKGAWGDYIPIGTIWILTIIARDFTRTWHQRVLLMIIGLFTFLSLGVLPMPGLNNPEIFISLAAIGILIIIGLNVWVVWRQRVPEPVMETAPDLSPAAR